MLLQVIPSVHAEGRENPRNRQQWTLSLSHNLPAERQALDPTEVVRTMLDKYTPKGSRILEGLLEKEDPKYVYCDLIPNIIH